MPSRQCRTIFHEITRRPQDAAFVLIPSGLVIFAENIKLFAFESLYQPFRYLLC